MHRTPASSEWPQLWESVCLHWSSSDSDPVQKTSSMKIDLEPELKKALPTAIVSVKIWDIIIIIVIVDMLLSGHNHCLLLVENPSCLHTTAASLPSQPSSHTVPQLPDTNTSTRPSHKCWPPTSLRAPWSPIQLLLSHENIQTANQFSLCCPMTHNYLICTYIRDTKFFINGRKNK